MIRPTILIPVCVGVLCLCIFGCDPACAQSAKGMQPDHVHVYYFYTNSRCVNCHNMEKWTKEVVEKDFANEADAGKVAFSMVNMEEKQNKRYVDDYRLYTKAVLLSVVKGGEEKRIENLLKIWEYLNSKERFQEYVKDAIAKALRDLI